ncbi:hypothetical protein V8E54_006590 [Elaphomyces granulatus]
MSLYNLCVYLLSATRRYLPTFAASPMKDSSDDVGLTTGNRGGTNHALETPWNAPVDGSELETESVPAPASTHVQPPQRDSRSLIPCKYHLRGTCRNGDHCPYAHSSSSNEIEARSGCQETVNNFNDDRDGEHDDFSREFSGAFVQFQDGCQISKIALPGDFSAIRINGLPLDSTRGFVSALLRDLEFQVAPALVRISRLAQAATVSADVKVEDPTFAKGFCAKLKSEKVSAARYSTLEALPVSPSTLSGSISRRVSCQKVHISWHKPTRSVWLNYRDKDVARRVGDKFNQGEYRVLGQMTTADPPKHSFYRDDRYKRNSIAWEVLLREVLYNSTSNDVEDSILLYNDKPRHIKMAKSENFRDPRFTAFQVKSLCTKVGSVKFEMNTQSQGKRFKASARFEEEVDAREAVRSLHGKPQGFLDGSRLTVQLVCSAKFKISTSIYDTLEEQLSAKSVEWRERYLQFKVYRNTDPLQRFTTLKIEGEQAKDVANATNTLEEILAGQTVTDGDAPVWSTAFTGNGATYQKLKQVEQQHDVVIIRNKAKKQLKFLGPPDKYQQVQRAIVELIKAESTAVYFIHLNSHEFFWACNGGFKQIATALGDHIASFDIVSKPRRVIITGSKKQHQTALDIIRGMVEPADFANTNKDCTICWSEAENPLLTSCNHLYCLQCFEDLCMSAMSGEKEASIFCQGEMGKCKKVLSLDEIQTQLSSAVFEEILEASFASYVRRHPQDLRYCPTPDCGYIYRTGTGLATSLHTCTKCLDIVCITCHEQHGFMSCADYEDLRSGGFEALKKYKEENGVKDCPSCTTPLEKTGGCNHMACGGCGVHICWVCSKVFKESDPCYAHLRSAHLSYF